MLKDLTCKQILATLRQTDRQTDRQTEGRLLFSNFSSRKGGERYLVIATIGGVL